MRILLLITDLLDAVGGIQSFNRSFVRALAEIVRSREYDVTVFALNDARREPRRLADRILYEAFGRDRIRFAWRAVQAGRGAQIVFFGHVHFTPLGLGIGDFSNGRAGYLIVHGIEAWQRLSTFQRMVLSRIRTILSVSAFTRDQMVRTNSIPPGRFEIFPHTLNPQFGKSGAHRRTRRELGLPEGKMILSVSRLDTTERRKGIDCVIKALPAVIEKVPDAFHVVVGDGDDRRWLEGIAREGSVGERVIFVGRLSDHTLADYYHTSDVFALPSTKEGFGIVFLEAMRFGKACLGAGAGGVPEVILDGKTGCLIDPGDISRIAAALTSLLGDPVLCGRMGAAGQERFEREFSFEQFRKRLEHLLTTA